MKLIPWLVILSLGLVGCSGSKSAQKVSEETPQVELSDADEFVDNPVEEAAGESSDVTEAPVEESAGSDEVAEAATEEAPPEEAITNEVVQVNESTLSDTNETFSGGLKQYTVQKNETLMIVAFKIYGDYGRWKEIANSNKDTLKGSLAVREGMVLNYMAPAEEFVWNPQGLPYLIRTGDTLGKISKNVYNTMSRWRHIWDNNRPLIKDPNKIYAGFTLYYIENGREVATEL